MKLRPLVSLLIVVVASAAVGWALTSAGSSARSTPVGGGPVPRVSAQSLPPGWSYLAVVRGHGLLVYPGAGADQVVARLRSPTSARVPLTLLVKRTVGNWVQTFLPTRPNGSLGWVRLGAVRLVRNGWALTVHLDTHRLMIWRAGQLVRTDPVAVGKPSTPTPVGTYFITELLQQPDPAGAYGPYAYGTSAHSTVIKHFGATGDGQIGVHGTDQPWVLGTSATHGCIRVSNADVVWLAKRLPLGTPLRIFRS
jgi:hypothetical protein